MAETRTRKPTGPFVVANPRGIPRGVRILHNGKKDWYEGDDISPSDLKGFDDLVERGFVVPKKGGS